MVWANNYEDRDSIVQVLEPTMGNLSRFVLPDNFYAVIMHGKNIILDKYEMKNIYRQDMIYYIEYPSTLSKDAYTITNIEYELQPNASQFMLDAPVSGYLTLTPNVYAQSLASYTVEGPEDEYMVANRS